MSNAPLTKQYATILGRQMAYFESGEGRPIVLLHGNPTSSYLWRDVIPHLEGLGRIIAPDHIGMGDSDKLVESGPDAYSFADLRRYLGALLAHLGVESNVVLVIHDWGSALGFDWANHHRHSVAGIAYMEAIVAPLIWDDFDASARPAFEALRSPAGESMVLEQNAFVEQVLPSSTLNGLSDEVLAEYRRPFAEPGEGRRPTLTLPRQLPIEGEPADVHYAVADYSAWMTENAIPKLFVNAEPGLLLKDRLETLARTWQNQEELGVAGSHFVQEDSGAAIGLAVADWIRRI